MPESFEHIPNCRAMIDCTKFFMRTPRKDLEAAAVSYSRYKHRLTSKALAKRLDFSLDFLLDKKSSRLATLLSESSGVE